MKNKYIIKNTIKIVIENRLLLIRFLVVFGVFKMISFLVPLFLSNNFVNIADYGKYEYIFSSANIFSIIVGLGINGAYPYFLIKKDKQNILSSFFYQVVFIFLVLLITYVLFYLKILAELNYRVMQLTSILALQSFYSTVQKTKEKSILSVFFDSGLNLILLSLILYSMIASKLIIINHVYNSLNIYLLIIIIYTLYFFKIKLGSLKEYFEIIKYATPILIATLLMILMTNSGRIIVEYFMNLKEVGYYSFYFRLASLIIVFHQIINILFFRKLYIAKATILDSYFSLFMLFVLITSVFLYILIPLITFPYLKLLRESYQVHQTFYLFLFFHNYYWISTALNENIIYRESLAKKQNIGFVFVILLFYLIVFIFSKLSYINLESIAIINVFCLFACTEVQFFLLKKNGVLFKKNKNINRLIFCFFIINVFVNYQYCFLKA